MSENMKKRFCGFCGTALSENGDCPACGHRDESDSVRLAADDKDDKKEAAALDVASDIDEKDEKDEKNVAKRLPIDDFSLLNNACVTELPQTAGEKVTAFFANKIVNRAIVLALSVLLFAAMLVPFVRYTLEYPTEGEGHETVTLSFTAVDSVELALRSFAFLSDEALAQTRLYAQTLSARDEGSLSQEELLKKGVMLTAMRQSTSLRVTVIGAALVSVAYAVLCTVLAGLSAAGLISELLLRKKKRSSHKRYAADGMLCMIACLLPVMIFCFLQAFDFGMSSPFGLGLRGRGVSLAWGAVATAALAVLGSIFVCAVNFFEVTQNDEKRVTKAKIRAFACCILVLAVLFGLLLPCVTVNLWNESEVTRAMTLDVFAIDEMPVNDLKYYRARFAEYNGRIVDGMSMGEIGDTFADDTGETLLHTVLIGRKDVRALYGASIAVTAITLAFAGLLLWKLLRHCFFGQRGLGGIRTFKVFASISLAAHLILLLVVTSTAQGCLQGTLSYVVEFRLGFGLLLAAFCMVAAVVLRLKDKKTERAVGYENPDVSYAPYQLDRRR